MNKKYICENGHIFEYDGDGQLICPVCLSSNIKEYKASKRWPFFLLVGVGLLLGATAWYLLSDSPVYTYVYGLPQSGVFIQKDSLKISPNNSIGYLMWGDSAILVNRNAELSHIRYESADGKIIEGFVANKYLVSSQEYFLLKSIFADEYGPKCLQSSAIRKALIKYFKENQLKDGSNENSNKDQVEPLTNNNWVFESTPDSSKLNFAVFDKVNMYCAILLRNELTRKRKLLYFKKTEDFQYEFVAEATDNIPEEGFLKYGELKYDVNGNPNVVGHYSMTQNIVEPEWKIKDINTGNGLLRYYEINIHSENPGNGMLVVFLHGLCNISQQNPMNIEHGQNHIMKFLQGNDIKGTIIFPLDRLNGGVWTNRVSDLKQLIDAHLDIDRKRIYITGTSNGGLGTYSMINAYPSLFAAAMPVAAGASMPPKNLPTCIVVERNKYEKSFEAKVKNNPYINYYIFPNTAVSPRYAHGETCQKAHSVKSLLEWLFSHSRN